MLDRRLFDTAETSEHRLDDWLRSQTTEDLRAAALKARGGPMRQEYVDEISRRACSADFNDACAEALFALQDVTAPRRTLFGRRGLFH